MSGYLNVDCKNCGRHRVEKNYVCEKCGFDNRENQYVNASGSIGKSGKEIIDDLYNEIREWQKVAASLNNSLCCYLDYCNCEIEYKCLAPKDAIKEYNKMRCGVWRKKTMFGKCEPSQSDVSTTQDVLMDIKKDEL